ncbi:MAG: MG2 domain-containing protein [Myxococcota bacterium]
MGPARAEPAFPPKGRPAVLAACAGGLLVACSVVEDGPLRASGPRVLSFAPSGVVKRTVPIRVEFSEPAPEAAVGRPMPIHAVALASPRLEATATFVDDRTLLIEPERPFEVAQRYRVVIREDALGAERPLKGGRAFGFRTEAFGLEDARAWRSGEGMELALRFSHPVRPAEVEAALVLRVGGVSRGFAGLASPDGGPVRRLSFRIPGAAKALEVGVDAGLASTSGGRPLGKPISRQVVVEGQPPLVDQVRPVQLGARWAVAIDLASDVAPSRLVGAVRGAGPSVRMALSPDGPWILGAFSPETTASLQIGPPLMKQPEPWVLELPALEPALRIVDAEPLLDLAPGARVEVEHHDVRSLVLTARAVPPELVGLLGVDRLVPAQPLPGSWAGTESGPVRRTAGRAGKTQVDPSSLLDGLPPGLVLLEVRDENRPWLRDLRYVNRRGLDVVVKRRRGYLWGQVHDLQGPVGGAELSVTGLGGKVLARANTDGRGVAVLRWTEGEGALALARADRRYAVLPLTGPFATRGSDRPGMKAWLVPDATTYAPGQTIAVSVLLADARNRPFGRDLRLELQRIRGDRLAEVPVVVESRGTGRATLEIPSDAGPGGYLLELLQEDGRVLRRARVEVRPRRGNVSSVSVMPAEGRLAFEVSLDGRSRDAAMQGFCHYRRLDTFAGLPPPARPAPALEPISVELGDGAPRVVRCPDPSEDVRPWEVRLVAHARDALSGEARRISAAAERYADIGLPDTPPRAGQPLDAQVRVVDARGRPVEGSVRVDIRPLQPRNGAQVRRDGRLVPTLLSVAGEPETLTLALVEGSAVVPFVPPRGGPWALEVEGAAAMTVWVAGAPGTPRPLELVLQRKKNDVRAALPFPGRLLLTEEDLEVAAFNASLETAVVAEHRLGRNGEAVSGLLLGADGRWSAARLPAARQEDPADMSILMTVKEDLVPGEPIEVSLKVRGPTWSGVFRVLAVDAGAAPTEAEVERWLADEEAAVPALDTLVTSAYDDPAPPVAGERAPLRARARVGRPARAAEAGAWLKLSSDGFGYTKVPWPEVSGRVRLIAVVRAGGRLGARTVDRVVGDGLGVDVVVPAAVRRGDRMSVPVLLDNGSSQPVDARIQALEEGFTAARDAPASVRLDPGAVAEARVPLLARGEGPLVLEVGEATVRREVARIVDTIPTYRGRGATASFNSSAVLPAPESLGARGARIVVGSSPVTRFAAALQAVLTAPVVDGEHAAAMVLVAARLPELTRALGLTPARDAAMGRLAEGLADPDPWVRVFAGHAALEASGAAPVGAAQQTLAEVAARPRDAAAAAYARLLLARLGRSVQAPLPENSGRADGVALAAAADVLLGRADRDLLEELPLAPWAGPREGRFSPTLVNALALFALDAVGGVALPVLEVLEAEIIGAARDSRWTHPSEEALALVALSARAERQRRRAYWGKLLLDGDKSATFNSQRIFVADLDAELSRRPEVTVTGAGSAEVGLVMDAEPSPAVSGPLRLSLRRVGADGKPRPDGFREGDLVITEVEVGLSGAGEEMVVLDVPTPAGLEVEKAPPKATRRPGGGLLVVGVPPGGTWKGRFEARARHAGVWLAPSAKARLRHGASAVSVRLDELIVNSGGPGRE